MKPDQYRIQNRTSNFADAMWGTFVYSNEMGQGKPLKRARDLSQDFPEADWRLQRYSDIRGDWVTVWTQLAEKPKPTEFEHRGVKLTFRKDGGINIKSPRREQWESGGAALQDHEVAALRAYFKSEA